MNWKPFRKGPQPGPAPAPTLSSLRPGFTVTCGLQAWRVTAQHRYEHEGGGPVDAWELTCGHEVRCLARERGGRVQWTLTRRVPLSEVQCDVQAHMARHEDPPDWVRLEGVEYEAEASSVGLLYEDGEGPGLEFTVWEYADETGKRVLYIRQWGGGDLSAAIGEVVEEDAFSDVRPPR